MVHTNQTELELFKAPDFFLSKLTQGASSVMLLGVRRSIVLLDVDSSRPLHRPISSYSGKGVVDKDMSVEIFRYAHWLELQCSADFSNFFAPVQVQ